MKPPRRFTADHLIACFLLGWLAGPVILYLMVRAG